MLIQIGNAHIFNAAPPQSGQYYPDDLRILLDQSGASALKEIVIEFPLGQQQFISAVIAIDSSGNLLDGTMDAIGLPCPPYCMQRITVGNVPIQLSDFKD